MVIMQIRWSNFGPLAKQLPSCDLCTAYNNIMFQSSFPLTRAGSVNPAPRSTPVLALISEEISKTNTAAAGYCDEAVMNSNQRVAAK